MTTRNSRAILRELASRSRGAAGPAGWAVHEIDRRRARRSDAGQALIPTVLTAFGIDHPDAMVVEVGANDGVYQDKLRHHLLTQREWRSFLLEPVPESFLRLCGNVSRIVGAVPVNAAISDSTGVRPFYTIRPPGPGETLWEGHSALASFDRDVVAKHTDFIADIEDRIVATNVPVFTADDFRSEFGVHRVDLLHIDTEGHDLLVLRQFDLAVSRPFVVVFEHWHLAEVDIGEAHRILLKAGYRWREEGLDTVAVRMDYLDDQATAMGELRDAFVSPGTTADE